MPMPRVVLDPGHGGTRPAGGSSPNHAHGPNGLLERDVVLDVARRAARRLAAAAVDVRLTRADDRNLPLGERARVARDVAADVFVSLHLNGAPDADRDGTEAWVARDADARSTRLAALVARGVAAAAGTRALPVARRDLGVLLPSRHAPGTAACLVELAYLSNPARAARLAVADEREAMAAALSDAIRGFVGGAATAADLGAMALVAAEYAGARQHAPSRDGALFACSPDPVAVTDATLLPAPTDAPDDASRGALRLRGLSAAQVATFERSGGLVPLAPIAAACGQEMLAELLARLRYSAAQLANPPHTWGADLRARLGVRAPAELLAARTLLAVPGHFRQLARRATDAIEAHALESLGWLMARALRDDVAAATRLRWWLPPHPDWVTPFGNPMPQVSDEVRRLFMRLGQLDTTLEWPDYRGRQQAWERGLAGAQWRFEIGADPASPGAGRPFYAAITTVPAAPDIRPQMRRIRQEWARRVAQVQAATGVGTPATTATLRGCANQVLAGAQLVSGMRLGGVELATQYPLLESQRATNTTRSTQFLDAIHPLAGALFGTIHALGWNDLLFHSAGSFCFRGIKRPANHAEFHTAATRISDHAFGIAIDVNTFENPVGRHDSTMDPRIVALFEAFHFRWGRCFRNAQGQPIPDPHHFEYDESQGVP